eukprot:GGOE01018148.1.p1 GENE.GGOE01018148.1~~GGOE01018148.1.p1  ORF type:complete len:482 (+),score=102.45 GGOE01018148.1:25-1470(+)
MEWNGNHETCVDVDGDTVGYGADRVYKAADEPSYEDLMEAPAASALERKLIVQQEELRALAEEVRYSEFLGVDMEMDNQFSYPDRLCLLQVATDSNLRLVDPLAPIDLQVLFDAFERRGPCWRCGASSSTGVDVQPTCQSVRRHLLCVAGLCCTPHRIVLHGGAYDIRMLARYHYRPSDLFDTSIAAKVLGEARCNLEALVQAHCRMLLDKQYQRTNWKMRPLAPEVLSYAINDVRYLQVLSETLEGKLRAVEKMAEHNAEVRKMVDAAYKEKPVDRERCWRVKGSQELSCYALAVLRSLWQWREAMAIQEDTPPYRLMRNELMCCLCRRAADMGWVEDHCVNRSLASFWPAIAQAIRDGLAVPETEWPLRAQDLLKAKPKAKPKPKPKPKEASAPAPTQSPAVFFHHQASSLWASVATTVQPTQSCDPDEEQFFTPEPSPRELAAMQSAAAAACPPPKGNVRHRTRRRPRGKNGGPPSVP